VAQIVRQGDGVTVAVSALPHCALRARGALLGMKCLMRLRAWIGIVAAMAVVWQGILLVRHSVTMAEALRHQPAPAPRPDNAAGFLVCADRLGAVQPSPQCRTLPAPAAPAVGAAETEGERVSPLQLAHPPRGPPIGA
jgi:hypothetical protein